jgi:signal transduction histidine kinase
VAPRTATTFSGRRPSSREWGRSGGSNRTSEWGQGVPEVTNGDGSNGSVARLDRLAALGELAAEIVHEIRNPLVSIKTFVELLPERLDDPEFRADFVSIVREEVRRIERLLDRVLEYGRPSQEPPSSTTAALEAVISWATDLLSHRMRERGVHLESSIASPLPHVEIEEDSLRQLVLNLLMNAIEASPHGSRVRLVAEVQGQEVIVHIEDEGPGVPHDLRQRVFEAFFSTKAERFGGLGLTVSRRMAEAAGGSLLLMAENTTPGAVFRLALPRAGAKDET